MQLGGNFYFFKGRVALYAILKALGVKSGDEVIIPGFTCVAVPNAIAYLGAKPVYADICPDGYNIDPVDINKKITGKTRAVIAQHTFGIPADMDPIADITKKNRLYLVEDACHSLGSKYKGRDAGALGDAAFFSSQWSKPATTGLGGWAKSNNLKVKWRLAQEYDEIPRPSIKESSVLRTLYVLHEHFFPQPLFWIARDAYRALSKTGLAIGSSTNEELSYRMPEGYLKKMSKWQTKALEKKLAGIDGLIEHRKWVVSQYYKMLPQAGFSPAVPPKGCEPVFLRYPVSVGDKNGVLESARLNRIELGDWFVSPVHPNLTGWEKIGYEKGMCPNAEMACSQTINLPTHARIGMKEIERSINFLSKFR